MRRTRLSCRTVLSVLFGTMLADPVSAHRPVFTEDAATSAATAIPIADPAISQVVYREITGKTPQVWLTFTVPKDFDLFVQIGVPAIERLGDFRPAIAVVGPGLPRGKVPFKLPKGTGARVFTTSEVGKPRFFHEHFTKTDSWILRSETVRLASPGTYHLVAFSPHNQVGKLWLSVGKAESFGPGDFMRFPAWSKRIREFHEVSRE
jgi:hypothetical protein